MDGRPELTCAVCLSTFNSTTKRPIDIGCHSFCAACYDTGSRTGSFRHCPECRAPATNPHINYSLLRCIEGMEASGSLPPPPQLPARERRREQRAAAPGPQSPTPPPAGCLDPSMVERALAALRSPVVQSILGMLYMLSPLDVIPDVIPILGFVDDFLVFLLFVLPIFLTLARGSS